MARNEIAEASQGLDFLTASTDLAGVSSQVGIVWRIARELRSKLRTHEALQSRAKPLWGFLSAWADLGVKLNRRVGELDPDELLDDLVSMVGTVIGGSSFDGVALPLDEADNPPLGAQLGEFVKVLTERLAKRGQSKLLLMLAGQSLAINRLREGHESSLRVFQVMEMKPLEPDERIAVVRRGIEIANGKNEMQTEIEEEALQLIASLSEGHPHVVQQLPSSAFAQDEDDRIDLDDVGLGAFSEGGAIAQLGAKYFSQMYFPKILSSEYRKVLDFMATRGDQWVSRKDIATGCDVAKTNLDHALLALKSREVILTDEARRGFSRLPTRSFAAWILAVGRSGRPDLFTDA